MPGTLPPQSAYTYCVELSADEAVAAAAKSVRFSQPVIQYVDNYLGFPAGAIVPQGYYDRTKAAWVASENGRVIHILSIVNGQAILDVEGNNTPATPEALAALGYYRPGTTISGKSLPARTKLLENPNSTFHRLGQQLGNKGSRRCDGVWCRIAESDGQGQ